MAEVIGAIIGDKNRTTCKKVENSTLCAGTILFRITMNKARNIFVPGFFIILKNPRRLEP